MRDLPVETKHGYVGFPHRRCKRREPNSHGSPPDDHFHSRARLDDMARRYEVVGSSMIKSKAGPRV